MTDYPELRKGDRCPAVLVLQDKLMQLGFIKAREISGVMDDKTDRAIRKFQLSMKMPITGIVDGRTWEAINKRIHERSK